MKDASFSLTDVLATAKIDPLSVQAGGLIIVAWSDRYYYLPTSTPYAELEQIIGTSTSATIVHRFIYVVSEWLEVAYDTVKPQVPIVQPAWRQSYHDNLLKTRRKRVQLPQHMSNHIHNAIRRGKTDKSSLEANGFIVITDGLLFSHLPTAQPHSEQDIAFASDKPISIVTRFARRNGRWKRVNFMPPSVEPDEQG